jgi:hypothetical protein
MHYSIQDNNMFNSGSVLTPLFITLDAETINFPTIYNKLSSNPIVLYNDYTNSQNLTLYDPYASTLKQLISK